MYKNGVSVIFILATALYGSGNANYHEMGLSTPDLEDFLKELNSNDYRYEPENYDDYYDGNEFHEMEARADPAEALKSSIPKSQPGPSGGNRGGSSVLPAYCDPPNPCPVGYDSNDGCIDDFENSSEFSREYQSTQNCLCDSEHMFNCPEDNVPQEINENSFFARIPGLTDELDGKSGNPYLSGQKLPIAAKKGGY